MCEQSIEGHELLLESRQAWIEGRAARALKRGAKRYERGKDVHGTARESNGLVRPFRLATYVGCVLCASLSGLGGGIHSTTVDESKILCSKPDFCLAVPPPRTLPAAMRSYRIVDLPVALADRPFSHTNLSGHRRSPPCYYKAPNSTSAIHAAPRSGRSLGGGEDELTQANFSPCGHPVVGLVRIEAVAA